MALENQKQLIIIVGAAIAGIAAVVLTSNYIKNSIQNQTAVLSEHYEAQQKDMVAQLQQRSEQQMASLSEQLQRVKAEDEENTRKQMAALQAAQQEQMRQMQAQQSMVAEAKRPVRKPSLALKTPVGKRAVTVKIDSLAAVGGLLNAGDFVDVIAELSAPSQTEDKKTLTAMIFQGLQVLAIDTNEDDPGAYVEQQAEPTLKVTFAVDPQEAGLLAFANKNGNLQLALRSPDDTDHQKVKVDTWKTLADYVLANQGADLNNPDNESQNKPQESKPNIQIFRGGKEL